MTAWSTITDQLPPSVQGTHRLARKHGPMRASTTRRAVLRRPENADRRRDWRGQRCRRGPSAGSWGARSAAAGDSPAPSTEWNQGSKLKCGQMPVRTQRRRERDPEPQTARLTMGRPIRAVTCGLAGRATIRSRSAVVQASQNGAPFESPTRPADGLSRMSNAAAFRRAPVGAGAPRGASLVTHSRFLCLRDLQSTRGPFGGGHGEGTERVSPLTQLVNVLVRQKNRNKLSLGRIEEESGPRTKTAQVLRKLQGLRGL